MFWDIGRFDIFLLVHYLPVLHTLYPPWLEIHKRRAWVHLHEFMESYQ